MQKCLEDNDMLMYLIQNEVKSVAAERIIKILKGKIYKRMTANNSKSYLENLSKFVDQYNNAYNRSIGKNLIYAIYYDLTKKIESSYKGPKFKVGNRFRITKYKNIVSKN